MFIQEYFTFRSGDYCYILVSLIRKSSTLQNNIRNQFTVRSGLSNTLQQHINTANELLQNC